MAVDALLAVPALLSWVCLLLVLAVHGRVYWAVIRPSNSSNSSNVDVSGDRDIGDFGWLQFWTCLAAFVSVLGSCVETLGLDDDYGDVSAGGEGGWCLFSAVCSSFGELAVILWVVASCAYLYAQLGERLPTHASRVAMFRVYHLFVWGVSFFMTVLPLGLGALGRNWNGAKTESWCWFRPNHMAWEWAQFYLPLVLYTAASLAAFTKCILIIRARFRPPPPILNLQDSTSGAGGATAEEGGRGHPGLALYTRMAWQLFVLLVIYLPDLVVVLVDETHGSSFHSGSRGAEFLWRCEGLALATLYILNGRVQTCTKQLPEYKYLVRQFCPLKHDFYTNDDPTSTTIAITTTAIAAASEPFNPTHPDHSDHSHHSHHSARDTPPQSQPQVQLQRALPPATAEIVETRSAGAGGRSLSIRVDNGLPPGAAIAFDAAEPDADYSENH